MFVERAVVTVMRAEESRRGERGGGKIVVRMRRKRGRKMYDNHALNTLETARGGATRDAETFCVIFREISGERGKHNKGHAFPTQRVTFKVS